jgi:hypothetical protein
MMTRMDRLSPVALLACIVVFSTIAGCNPFRRGDKVASCNRPQLYGAAESVPPLRIPAGLDAPNTRGAMVIPGLTEPEAPRRPSDPCLDEPPKFSNTARLEPLPRDRKGKTEPPKPAPAVAPVAAPTTSTPPAR